MGWGLDVDKKEEVGDKGASLPDRQLMHRQRAAKCCGGRVD